MSAPFDSRPPGGFRIITADQRMAEQRGIKGVLLNKQLDDFNRPYFSLQVEGSKTGLELPGIVDEVITLAELPRENETPIRGFVCTTLNAFG